ncbi:hypothetical protein BRAS3843_2000004 [Bradyrhizobium sp. STM 3843]|nr:hypothetical protein BRAS3843_2000004 [Bradyrhizobium sp. STM 3843]
MYHAYVAGKSLILLIRLGFHSLRRVMVPRKGLWQSARVNLSTVSTQKPPKLAGEAWGRAWAVWGGGPRRTRSPMLPDPRAGAGGSGAEIGTQCAD